MADDCYSYHSIPTGSSHNTTPTESFNLNELLPVPNIETDDSAEWTSQTGSGKLDNVVWQHYTKTGEGKYDIRYFYPKKLLGVKSKSTNEQSDPVPEVTKGGQEIVNATYDLENANKELLNAIIMNDYPLSIVDRLWFRRYSAALQPSFQVPSQDTIKKEILKVYDVERSKVLKLLASHEGRVAITSNMWTSSNQNRGYMEVTAHYIDCSWTLQSHILRFIYVPAPHTSDNLTDLLVKCLRDWNINRKLSTITLDRWTTHDSLMDKIKFRFAPNTLLRDGSLLSMRCFAHILNMLAKDGLDVVNDVVEMIRNSIVYWTATSKRKDEFMETAKIVEIPYSRCLSLDCPTTWTSTYKMLDVAISYRDVFSRLKLLDFDCEYTCFPTESQWEFAKDILGRLKLFHNIAELMSGTKYPTPNIYFPKICELKLAISQWINSPNEVIQEMAKKMMVYFERYWNVIHDIMGIATILDPRYKMEFFEFYYAKLNEADSLVQIERIRKLFYELFSDYQLKMRKESPLLNGGNNVSSDALSDYDLYVASKKRARTSCIKKELDNYLEEEVLQRTPNFDILFWWKLNGVRYPTLQAIAKDVLAIPISAVGSESAFNTDGLILSPRLSRLHWNTLEALICARSWLRSVENSQNKDSKATQDWSTLLDEMESEIEDEMLFSSATS